ncbi:MAG: phosphotransferase [Acidobacteria bacterium]|nr:phosphotransferase [Acidobacteriota bacterium]
MPGMDLIEDRPLHEAISRLLAQWLPGARIVSVSALTESRPERGDGAAKFLGYGSSLRVEVETAEGMHRKLVFRTSRTDDFGHDRRADRAADALLAFDTFPRIPGHVAALDVGAIDGSGELVSLRGAGEFYTVTDYVEGTPYAEDLWRIAERGELEAEDLRRCDALADWLVGLHAEKLPGRGVYRRAIRDLIGHGEGIFGLVDNFPDDVPGIPLERLRALERRSADWRYRLRGRERRLSRTHGDFHPFNILFGPQGELRLLDASRGCAGDPADDVACLAVNYVFFALEHEGSWDGAFAPLWSRFWERYLNETRDEELLEAAPPFLAWRILVLTNPLWYPNASKRTREALLGLAERALEAGRLEQRYAEELFD